MGNKLLKKYRKKKKGIKYYTREYKHFQKERKKETDKMKRGNKHFNKERFKERQKDEWKRENNHLTK